MRIPHALVIRTINLNKVVFAQKIIRDGQEIMVQYTNLPLYEKKQEQCEYRDSNHGVAARHGQNLGCSLRLMIQRTEKFVVCKKRIPPSHFSLLL